MFDTVRSLLALGVAREATLPQYAEGDVVFINGARHTVSMGRLWREGRNRAERRAAGSTRGHWNRSRGTLGGRAYHFTKGFRSPAPAVRA